MLEEVKSRLGIDSAITVYDSEIKSLIQAALSDMAAAGVPADLLEEDTESPDGRVLLCVTAFVRANYGDDRTNSARYTTIFREMVFRLCQEEGGD